MNTENILWAFFSLTHYENNKCDESAKGKPLPKDVYYKNSVGEWVKVSSVFECIERARRVYPYDDIKYLGAVDSTTKTEVECGAVFPPPKITVVVEEEKLPVKKKKKKKISTNTEETVLKNKKVIYNKYDYTYCIFDDYLGPDY